MALAPSAFTVMGLLGVVVYAISPKVRTPEAKRYLAIYILSLVIGWIVIELHSSNSLNEIWLRLLGALLLIACVYGFLFGGVFLFTSVTSSDGLEANNHSLKGRVDPESVNHQQNEFPERASNVSGEILEKIQFEQSEGLKKQAATGAKINLPRIYDEPINISSKMHVSICKRCSTPNQVKPAKYITIICKSCGSYYTRRIIYGANGSNSE